MANQLKIVEDAIKTYIDTLTLTGTGYTGEFPDAADSETVAFWYVAMEGGTDVHIVQDSETTYAWEMNVYFRGIYGDRETAQADLWKVMEALPIPATDVASVNRIDATASPSIVRDIFVLDNDLTVGGDLRVWLVELPMTVSFPRA